MKYLAITHQVSNAGHSHPSEKYTIETVTDPTATSYLLRNLRKVTVYEIKVQPFYQNVLGQESTFVTAHTSSDVPSAVPYNIHTHMIDNRTMYVSWSPIPVDHHNGQLLGYKVHSERCLNCSLLSRAG